MEAFQKTAEKGKGHSVPQAPLLLYTVKAQPQENCCTLDIPMDGKQTFYDKSNS